MIYWHHQSVSIWGHCRYLNSYQEIQSGIWERNLTKENQPVFIGPAQLISNSFVSFYDNSYFQLQVLLVVVASIKSYCRYCCCCCCRCCQFNAAAAAAAAAATAAAAAASSMPPFSTFHLDRYTGAINFLRWPFD